MSIAYFPPLQRITLLAIYPLEITRISYSVSYSVSEKISDRYGNENNFSCFPVVCISIKNRCVRKDKHKTLSFGKHKVLF